MGDIVGIEAIVRSMEARAAGSCVPTPETDHCAERKGIARLYKIPIA
jgi:hypothetical protein